MNKQLKWLFKDKKINTLTVEEDIVTIIIKVALVFRLFNNKIKQMRRKYKHKKQKNKQKK